MEPCDDWTLLSSVTHTFGQASQHACLLLEAFIKAQKLALVGPELTSRLEA